MPSFLDPNDSLLQGLSSFWLRLFADKDQLSALYEGSDHLLGQAYLDILESVLGRSLDGAPAYHREYWKLLTLRKDQVVYSSTGPTYTLTLPGNIADLTYLHNVIFSPSVTLEKGVDFTITPSTDTSAAEIVFTADPFLLNGVATSLIDVVPLAKQTGSDGAVSGTSFTSASASFNAYNVGDSIIISSATQSGTYPIVAVVSSTSVTLGTSLSAESALTWTLQGPSSTKEISFWVPDAMVDEKLLSDSYGWLVGFERISSEAYRGFLKGIFQYYILGAALSRVEAALNVAISVPVILTEGETIQSIVGDTVTTDKNTYVLPAGSVKPDLILGQVLPVFFSLTTIFTVTDYVQDPTWWWNAVVPDKMIPGESFARRQIRPTLYENRYDNPSGLVKYGDPGVYYGADDDGRIAPASRPGLRHLYSYIMMDRVLKYNILTVFMRAEYLPEDIGPGIVTGLIASGKPAYLFMYAQPQELLSERLSVSDILITSALLPEPLSAPPNVLTYGSSGAVYGSYYSLTSTSITTGVGTPDMTLGQTLVCYGGDDPFAAASTAAQNKTILSWPVQIKQL